MKRALLLLAICSCFRLSFAQQIEACEDEGSFVLTSNCGSACVLCDLDGFTTSNNITEPGTAPAGFCATALHNIQWVGFVAGTEDVTIEIDVFDCSDIDEDDNGVSDGLQIGIYNTTDCDNFTLVSNCEAQIEEGATGVFENTDPLVPGGIYFLVVDGFNGDICSFTATVTEGSTEAPTVDQVSPTINVIDLTCPSPDGELTATVDLVDGAGAYFWTLDGVEIGSDPSVTFSTPNFETTMELCVTPYNPCSEGLTSCTTITVQELEDVIYDITICEGDSYTWPVNNGTYDDEITLFVPVFVNGTCQQWNRLFLTVEEATSQNVAATICEGETYTITDPVNGSTFDFTTAGSFSQLINSANGCDSTVNLNLSVIPTAVATEMVTICQGDSYTVTDGMFSETLTSAGVYSYTLQTPAGCDSLLTLMLSVSNPAPVIINETICQGDSYFIGTTEYTTSGSHTETIMNAFGCDSTVTVNLNVHVPEFDITEVICTGDEVVVDGTGYGDSGNYTIVIPNGSYLGCDSIVNLDLTVEPASITDMEAEICEGEEYMLGNDTFTEEGQYTVVVSSGTICDEVVNLDLTVHPNTESSYEDETCFGFPYEFHGDFLDESGTYMATVMNSNGCDSVITLELTVYEENYQLIEPVICQGQVFEVGDEDLTTAGSYFITLQGANGCDSIIDVILDVLPAFTSSIDASICSGQTYTFNNVDYDQSGMYPATFQTADGCDSTVTLNLTVADAIMSTVDAQICEGQTYYVGQDSFSMAGAYQIPLVSEGGCDSIVNLNLSITESLEQTELVTICEGDTVFVGTTPYTTTGMFPSSYTSVSGCDSTYILDLTVLPNTSATINPVICSGTTFSIGGETYDSTDTYQVTLVNADGCDSLVTVNLLVEDQLLGYDAVTLCAGDTAFVEGMPFTATGLYEFDYVTAEGCDSLYQLDLTIQTSISSNINAEICEGSSYVIGDSTLTVPGVYDIVLTSFAGCDSTVTVNLGITQTLFTPLDISICDGDTAFITNIPYTTTGDYEEMFVTAEGCDSIVQLALTVLPNPTASISPVICSGQSFSLGGQTFDSTGVYAVTLVSAAGCDSLVTVNLTVDPPLIGTEMLTICEGDSVIIGSSVYNQTGQYEDAFVNADGCDSLHQLDLTVIPTSFTTIDPVICSGQSFEIDGASYTETESFDVTFTTVDGCDSIVTVNLTVSPPIIGTGAMTICEGDSVVIGSSVYNQSGQYEDAFVTADGCDSLYQLDLTVIPTTYATIDPAICNGEVFELGTGQYDMAGQYEEILTSAAGCDSVVTINLTILPTPTTDVEATICQDESYMVGDSTFTTAGIHTVVLSTVDGCDSTVVLDLSVTQFYETDLVEVICADEEYELGMDTYNTTGIYQATFQTVDGCDSIVTLDLTVNPLLNETLDVTLCQGESFSIAGVPYSTPGTHTETIPSVVTGCDSTITLNLTINQTFTVEVEETICDGASVMIGDSTYTTTGTFSTPLISADGCDSTVVLTLEVIPIPEELLDLSICEGDSVVIGNSVYTETGEYTDILTSVVSGCDSIVQLDLTVIPTVQEFLVEEICDGDTYEVGPESFTETGNYTVLLSSQLTGCDSIVELDLTVNEVFETPISAGICTGESYEVGPESFSETGVYTVLLSSEAGCDSTVVLTLSVAPCALDFELSSDMVDCHGNATGSLSFMMTIGTPPYTFSWANGAGGPLGEGTLDNNNEMMEIPGLAAGPYTIQVQDANGVTIEINGVVEEPAPLVLATEAMQFGAFNTSCAEGDDGMLTASAQGGVGPYSFNWSNGGAGEAITSLGAGTYSVTVVDANGCTTETEATLQSPMPLEAMILPADPTCQGENTGTIMVEETFGGSGPYLYAINGGAYGSSPVFANLSAGLYQVSVQDVFGCEWDTEVALQAAQELMVDLGMDIRMEFGDTINLEALSNGNIVEYRWAGGPLLDCPGMDTLNCYNPRIAPPESTAYSVTVVDEDGCTAEDRINVIVEKQREVFVPTAFSPDGDGVNDTFTIFAGNEVREIKSFLIYNRWGEEMYSLFDFMPNSPVLGWDGSHRGQMMNAGVYVYFAEVEFTDGEVIVYKGDVVLLR